MTAAVTYVLMRLHNSEGLDRFTIPVFALLNAEHDVGVDLFMER